jgi:glycine dehydrogenase subunit 1
MRYLPHTIAEITSMLSVVGVKDLDGLFGSIPEDCRRKAEPDLPDRLTEWELDVHMNSLAADMAVSPAYKVFLGAGRYDHYRPAALDYLLARSEFVTAYTPYQPEVSQGTLQAIFEYQTLAARLLGMDLANASMYDGASALAEALLMAIRINRSKKTVALSRLIHPLYRRVVQTYFKPTDFNIIEIPYLPNGQTDLSALDTAEDLAAVAVQSPNFFGCIEDLKLISERVHALDSLLITSFSEPLAYGLLENPGRQGADITCGEGQSFGLPRSFGGPGLGMLATKKQFMRNMPGRLIGQTTDKEGKRGFVITLATREQHIRREKATSNICTNQNLCAITAAMYMAALGGTGIRELARLNYDKTEYLKSKFKRAGLNVPFNIPTFNEFVLEFPTGTQSIFQQLLKKKIVAGLPLANYYPELANHTLLCVTETCSRKDLDTLVEEVAACMNE